MRVRAICIGAAAGATAGTRARCEVLLLLPQHKRQHGRWEERGGRQQEGVWWRRAPLGAPPRRYRVSRRPRPCSLKIGRHVGRACLPSVAPLFLAPWQWNGHAVRRSWAGESGDTRRTGALNAAANLKKDAGVVALKVEADPGESGLLQKRWKATSAGWNSYPIVSSY